MSDLTKYTKKHFEEFKQTNEQGQEYWSARQLATILGYAEYRNFLIVAQGQTYFAIQTRRQELSDDQLFQQLKEDEKRIFLRNELKEHNKQLVSLGGRPPVFY